MVFVGGEDLEVLNQGLFCSISKVYGHVCCCRKAWIVLLAFSGWAQCG